jgi:CubicO group peptidase (beta-lactamase class C family)
MEEFGFVERPWITRIVRVLAGLGFASGLWSSFSAADERASTGKHGAPRPPALSLDRLAPRAAELESGRHELPLHGLVPLTPERWAELDAYIAAALRAFDVPGAAVALIQNGRVEHIGTYGVRGVLAPERVDRHTRFLVGSVTKAMTTTLAATLVSEGRLGWDDAIVDYLPSFALSQPEWSALVRLRDAFGHTSGVPRSDVELYLESSPPLELVQGVAALPVLAPPGERYEYQNQVFSVGGFAVVRAAGIRAESGALALGYERLLAQRVFEPLGMERSTASFGLALADDNHAWPHAFDGTTEAVAPVPIGFERAVVPVLPAGGVWSSIDDMARFFALHLREGQSLHGAPGFPEPELGETHTPQIVADGGSSYGLGWAVADTAIGTTLGHDGGSAGFTARVYGLPEHAFGLVILANRSGGMSFLDAVTQYAFELAYALPHAGDAERLAFEADANAAVSGLVAALAPIDPEAIVDYVGSYEQGFAVEQNGDDLAITTAYGDLSFRAVPGVGGTVLCVDGALAGLAAQFSTDERGQVTLSIGLADFDAGALARPVVAARQLGAGHAPRARREAAVDLRMLPSLPHLRRPPERAWGPF